jgi:hypothetical protein
MDGASECTFFLYGRENSVLQRAFKINNVLDAAKRLDLRGHKLKIQYDG